MPLASWPGQRAEERVGAGMQVEREIPVEPGRASREGPRFGTFGGFFEVQIVRIFAAVDELDDDLAGGYFGAGEREAVLLGDHLHACRRGSAGRFACGCFGGACRRFPGGGRSAGAWRGAGAHRSSACATTGARGVGGAASARGPGDAGGAVRGVSLGAAPALGVSLGGAKGGATTAVVTRMVSADIGTPCGGRLAGSRARPRRRRRARVPRGTPRAHRAPANSTAATWREALMP